MIMPSRYIPNRSLFWTLNDRSLSFIRQNHNHMVVLDEAQSISRPDDFVKLHDHNSEDITFMMRLLGMTYAANPIYKSKKRWIM